MSSCSCFGKSGELRGVPPTQSISEREGLQNDETSPSLNMGRLARKMAGKRTACPRFSPQLKIAALSPFISERMCYNVFKPNQPRIPMPKTRVFSDHEKRQAMEPLHQPTLRRRQIATLSEKSFSLSDKRTMWDKVLTNQQQYDTLTLTLALHAIADKSLRRPQSPPTMPIPAQLANTPAWNSGYVLYP